MSFICVSRQFFLLNWLGLWSTLAEWRTLSCATRFPLMIVCGIDSPAAPAVECYALTVLLWYPCCEEIKKKNSLNQLKILSKLGQAGVLAGFKGIFGTFKMVRLVDQLADCLSQLNTSLARIWDHLKPAKISLCWLDFFLLFSIGIFLGDLCDLFVTWNTLAEILLE